MIEKAAELGFEELDLGPGPEAYKRAFASDQRKVMSGAVTFPGIVTLAREVRSKVEALCAAFPVSRPSEWTRKALRRWDSYIDFRC